MKKEKDLKSQEVKERPGGFHQKASADYDAGKIQVLEGMEAVRMRPAM